MRRRVGAAAIKKKKIQDEKFKEKANELAAQQLQSLTTQLDSFHSNLEEFAVKHKQDIRKDPKFRHQFQQMCASIGVDPLASGKGFWSEMLGVGTFYYELGIQAIEVCMATRPVNGGLISIKELHKRLVKTRGKYGQDISVEDIKTSIKKLKLLGTGMQVHGSGDTAIVQSVPGELNMDHTAVLEYARKNKGKLSPSLFKNELKWSEERLLEVLDYMVGEGMAWIDSQSKSDKLMYWFPSLYLEDKNYNTVQSFT